MIEIKDKSKCCGCETCFNACPKHCIVMKEDKEGFRYPFIEKEKCINCGLCEKVCPLIKEPEHDTLQELEFYAAYNNNDIQLKNSSSGGIFFLLAEKVLKEKGVVYGVAQDSVYDVKFIRATTEEECRKMQGSKYLQAIVGNIYIKVKEDLEKNITVLFSGTPCQIAGLYKFVRKRI